MLINKTKRAKQNLERLPCIPLQAEQVEFIYHSSDFKQQIIQCIRQAKSRIYFTALYWQNDEAGQQILDEIYRAKQANPELEVKILVDWHRAQRNLLGAEKSATNADWYCDERSKYQLADDPNIFFGVPINTREVFGVLHIKGLCLMIRFYIAVRALIMCIYTNKQNIVMIVIIKLNIRDWLIS